MFPLAGLAVIVVLEEDLTVVVANETGHPGAGLVVTLARVDGLEQFVAVVGGGGIAAGIALGGHALLPAIGIIVVVVLEGDGIGPPGEIAAVAVLADIAN